jgi:dTDP-4-dehydrorhamnose 3,5-epimerase
LNTMSKPSWQLAGASRDAQSVTADWMPARALAIRDVTVLESRWVIKSNGRLTELFRADWFGQRVQIDQVFHVLLNGHCISAWHVHEHTTDRLFVAGGHARVVLYDSRSESASYGRVLELLLSEHRPQLVVVPPGIWHGVENVDHVPALIVNMPDRAYDYEDPDHWRLPPTTSEIPYTFRGAAGAGASA